MKACHKFCCVSCVDGSCPIALRVKYEEYCMDVIKSCKECYHYDCKNCDFENTEYCPKFERS